MPMTAQLAHNIVESFLDIDAVLGGSLNKLAAELSGKGASFLSGDFAFGDSVAFVSHKHYRCWAAVRYAREVGRARVGRRCGSGGLLDSLYLVVEFLDALERGTRRDAVDQNKAFAVAYPLVS